MTRKRSKKKTFSATKAVKAAAREHIGMPSPTRVAPAPKQRQARTEAKHKPTLQKLLSNEAE